MAQHTHSHANMKGPNGGPMQDVAGVHAELVVSDNTIMIYAFNDEGRSRLSTKGYSRLAGADRFGIRRETVALVPIGETALRGEAKARIAPTASLTLVLRTAGGKSGQVKFLSRTSRCFSGLQNHARGLSC